MPEHTPLARLNVDLGAVRRNIRLIKETAKGAIVAPAVKADGYGLGMAAIAPVLAEEGCDTFFVETSEEGAALRALLPDATVYVIYGLNAAPAYSFVRQDMLKGLRPVLSHIDDVRAWLAIAPEEQRSHCAIKINTGMNRLGMSLDDLSALIDDGSIAALSPALAMSHLAFSEEPEHPMNREQLEAFQRVRAMLPDTPASFANSGGIMAGSEYHFDMVRPGIGIYGGNPFSGRENPFEAVAHLEAKIMQVRRIDVGDTVGYGATHRADKPTRIATLGVGYSGGYARSFDNVGWGVLDGVNLPVLGRVSMGSVVVDVSECAEDSATPGRYVSLIGGRAEDGVRLEELSRAAERSPYEVLVQLRLQQTRVYTDSNS